MPQEDAVRDERDAVARYAGPDYRRLLDAARRSLERTGGDLTRTITVKTPDDRERRVIIEITGQYRPEGVGLLAVRLADLDQAVRAATGHDLPRLLERLGPALRDRPAERQRLAEGSTAVARGAAGSFLASRGWYQSWLAELTADGTLARLVSGADADQLDSAVRVLEWVEQRMDIKMPPAQMAELAATTTGDARALGHGTTLSALVLRGLAFRLGAERPRTTEERRDLWDRSGVIVDDLASQVLVLNLPATGTGLGEWLTSARSLGTPFRVTLHQLVTLPLTVRPGELVHVCENTAVLRRAAVELGPDARPLLCTEGQPSPAFHRLARAVTGAGGRLRYHGDFDWRGMVIAAGVIARHGARPWHLSAADYEAAVRRAVTQASLLGPAQPTPWDPALARTMTALNHAIGEELVADDLLADLADLAGTPGDG